MTDLAKANIRDQNVVEIIEMLQKWHANRVQKLRMIVGAPADTELMLRGENGKEVLLIGDERKGFKAGCATALELFGKFPLTMTKTISDDTDAEEE